MPIVTTERRSGKEPPPNRRVVLPYTESVAAYVYPIRCSGLRGIPARGAVNRRNLLGTGSARAEELHTPVRLGWNIRI